MYCKPDFERVRTALLCLGEPDRVPLMELGVDKRIKEVFLKKKIETLKDEVEFWYTAGYDYINLSAKYNIDLLSGKRQVVNKRTWADENIGVISTEEDFENYPFEEIEKTMDFSVFEEIQQLLPPGMKIIARAADIFTFSWQLFGFENFCFAMFEKIELVSRVMNRVGEIVFKMLEREVSYPNIGAIWYSDDIAYVGGFMVSPEFLRTHLFPWIKKMGDLAKSKNIPLIYHTDGNILPVIDELIELGINALHPIEPKAMDIRELKKKYGGKLCLIGNVDVDILCRGTPEDVEDLVKQLIRDVAPGGGLCIGSSNSVPNYVKVENYKTMIETVKKYGSYPIRI